MSAVKIGRIATGRKVRIHLAVDGQTGCGANRRAGIAYPVVAFDAVDHRLLCLRCWTPARIERAEMALYTATGPAASAARRFLAAVVDARRTPAERAAIDDLARRLRESMLAAGTITALPVDERPRSWAVLRAEFNATHPQPVAV
jgi:hypothetical protein